MRCEKPGKCDKFEEVMMVKRTHGEKRHTIRGMGLARRKQEPCKRSVLRKSCTFIEIFFRNRLTKTRRDGKIYRQSAVAVKIESGRVPEWPMGTDCKSAAFQLRWFESTRAHQKNQRRNYAGFCFARHLKSHSRGWIRTAAATSLKMAQKQPGGLFLAARLAISTRAHQEIQYPNRVLDFLFRGNFLRAGREEGKCEKQSLVLAQARRVC